MNAASPGPADVKVSVAMITYNHETFIAQAIESALMQQTDFEYELIIGEDCSTDGTRAIVAEYARHYPERIRPLLHEHNLGLQGKNNFVVTLNACRGQYVAILEGDDYWTSPDKLQRQADFLDVHEECAICFHDVIEFDEVSGKTNNFCPPDQKMISALEDLLRTNFIHTCSTLFRNHLFSEFPNWFFSLVIGDWPLHVLNAQRGKIGYIDEVMAVYRIHRDSLWSSAGIVWKLTETIRMFEKVNIHFKGKYSKIIKITMGERYFELARVYERDGDLFNARINAFKAIAISMPDLWWIKKGNYGTMLRLLAPSFHRILKYYWNHICDTIG